MEPGRTSIRTASLLIAIGLFTTMLVPGCGSASVPERAEEIDEVFRAGTSRLADTTAFMVALEGFDFENTMFLEDVRDALDAGSSAVTELRASIGGLRGFDYGGALAALGLDIDEYSSTMGEALDELEGVYAGLDDIMNSIEPILRAEAVITQMEAPLSDEEFMDRLTRLDEALVPSLAELKELHVPGLLTDYEALFEDILTTLHKLVGDLIAAVNGLVPEIVPTSNPDFLSLRELLAGYPALVVELKDHLKITAVDPLVEQVELEISRLYLDEGK